MRSLAIILLLFYSATGYCQCIAINTAQPKSDGLQKMVAQMGINTFTAPVVAKNFVLRPDYYAAHTAFFCRQEIKLQKLGMPLLFRVGTVDQCNYLEQKPGYK